ncbi:MAG TPA: hypothetical protein VF069_03620 [Streptosporangiaceae bacterium]
MTDQPQQEPARARPGPQPSLVGRWALALGGVAVMLMIVFPPAAPVPAAAALFVGVRARRRARREPAATRGALAGLVMGCVALAISIPLATTQILLWGELDRYLTCREAANTITDDQACKTAFFREVEKKLNLREGSLQRYSNLPL